MLASLLISYAGAGAFFVLRDELVRRRSGGATVTTDNKLIAAALWAPVCAVAATRVFQRDGWSSAAAFAIEEAGPGLAIVLTPILASHGL